MEDSLPSLKLTFSPLKMDGWKMNFLLEGPIFRGELLVSGRVISRTFMKDCSPKVGPLTGVVVVFFKKFQATRFHQRANGPVAL